MNCTSDERIRARIFSKLAPEAEAELLANCLQRWKTVWIQVQIAGHCSGTQKNAELSAVRDKCFSRLFQEKTVFGIGDEDEPA